MVAPWVVGGGEEEGGLSSTVSAVARRGKKLITLNSFQSFKFVCVDLRRQCDQMWQFSAIWVFWEILGHIFRVI